VNLLHASSVLAWLQEEPGTRLLQLKGNRITALDWGCVLDSARHHGADPRQIAALLYTVGLRVEPIYEEDVLRAANLDPNQCLADRIAQAVAERLDAPLITSESLWNLS
jgi:PIN domain nuclease of toxin-antitoxin system